MDAEPIGAERSQALVRRTVSPRVYFARAIDGQDPAAIAMLVTKVREELDCAGLTLVDPAEGEPPMRSNSGIPMTDTYRALVDHDLSILKSCNAVLMDMTLLDRTYIGCVCELTYAYLWQIPCVIYVGDLDGRRPWLHYHAAAIVKFRAEAISYLVRMLLKG